MATILFDKMATARKLEGDGLFTRLQAETLAEVYHDAMSQSAATKGDVTEAKAELKGDIAKLRTDLAEAKNQIVLWLAVLMFGSGLLQHFLK